MIERYSYDLEMKTREQNKNKKRTEIKRFDWFIERKQTHLAFGWLSKRSAEKNFMPEELSRSCFDVILQHDWSMEQCLLHIRVFFGGKTRSPCFVLFIHWLIKQITNAFGNHFSRSNENRSITKVMKIIIGPDKIYYLLLSSTGHGNKSPLQ